MVVVVGKAGTITSRLVFKNLSYLISLIVAMVRHPSPLRSLFQDRLILHSPLQLISLKPSRIPFANSGLPDEMLGVQPSSSRSTRPS